MTGPPVSPDGRVRCAWVGDDPLYVRYHDEEWGVPSHDDRHLFEMLVLEGAQAGLSWATILRKRGGYRAAFAGFDAAAVARFGAPDVERLLADPGIVRNRLKVESTITNARAVLEIQREQGSLDRLLWRFVGEVPRVDRWRSLGEIPAETAEFEGDEPRAAAARLQVRRADDLLRAHAGGRARERPRGRLLPTRRTRGSSGPAGPGRHARRLTTQIPVTTRAAPATNRASIGSRRTTTPSATATTGSRYATSDARVGPQRVRTLKKAM